MNVHTSAVVLIPPEDAWAPIQAIRQRHDSKICRWMPHITLLYPFLPVDQFERALDALTEICRSFQPLNVRLTHIDRFLHGRGRTTFWAAPQPKQAIVDLQQALFEAIPECRDQNKRSSGFNPHLTVGRGKGKTAQRTFDELTARWSEIAFEVDSIALIAREGDGPFKIERILKFGLPVANKKAISP
jgi:RNA 2',3'-cyclic 3'-phosphodiesterase